jgi:hypothetical protein
VTVTIREPARAAPAGCESLEQLWDIDGTQWFAEEVALQFGTRFAREQCRLFLLFDAFRNNRHAQTVAQADHRPYEWTPALLAALWLSTISTVG